MSRSAAQATRFTATGPHAYSKPPHIASSASPPPASTSRLPLYSTPQRRIPRPNPSSATTPQSSSPPSTETPAQKVARLRAARDAEKSLQITLWDRIVVNGRIWADRAHKYTIMGLILISILSGIFTVYSVGSMMLYNRRRKKVYFALLAEKNHELLLSAIEAERAGEPLSKDQQSILDRERNRLRYEDEQAEKKKRGWGIQEFLIGGLKMSEVEGDEVEVEVEVEVEGAREPEGEVMKAVEEKKREDEMDLMKNRNGGAGGSLDRMAERAAELGKSKIGWGSWWGRK